MWKIEFVNTALKDSAKVRRSPHHAKVTELLVLLTKNPFQNPPPYKSWNLLPQTFIRGVLTANTA